MEQTNTTDVMATVRASAPRRWLAISMLAFLGFLLIYFGVVTPPASLQLQIFVVVLGALSVALAVKMHAATQSEIYLTEAGLFDRDGTEIAAIDQIERVERGAFAFKPSNGFMLRLAKGGAPRAWRPGLWWRFGRRIGVGGVTPGSQSKIMAEMIQAMIAERDGN